jgi:hypothetical protein
MSTARTHFRAYGRRSVDLEAKLQSPDGWTMHAVRIRDLGLGGARIHASERAARVAATLEPGTRLSLEVMAPTLWDPLVLAVVVVWQRSDPAGSELGLRIEHREAAALSALFQLLGAQAYEEA